MAEKQKLKCSACREEFEFDPNSDEQVIRSLNENFRPALKSNVEVKTYNNLYMTINIDDKIRIELIEEKHSQSIFDMVNENRNHLRQWLPFVDRMQTVEFTKKLLNGNMQRNRDGIEYAFVIFNNDKMVGRIGVYKIDNQNSIGEIGYWIIENSQGNGIVSKCCKGLIDFCFNALKLNRIEIKCGTENFKSNAIPEKLNFTKEGVIRQGELLYDKFIDLNLYSFLKVNRTYRKKQFSLK